MFPSNSRISSISIPFPRCLGVQQVRLIVGVAKLHGPARSLDLAILAESQRKLQLITEELVGRLGSAAWWMEFE